MLMNRWRVGSLSMGIILLASGAVMLLSLTVQINMLNVLLTFWPVILICLGVEILLHLFVRKDGENAKMRYDVLSIVFVSFVLIVSMFFYFVTFSIGLLGTRDDMYTVFGIKNEDVYAESSEELYGASELVVFSGFNSVKAISSPDGNIRVGYSIAFNTNDKEYASSMLGSVIKFETGERAYMLSNVSMFYNNRKMSYPIIDCVIYLPKDKILDMSQFNGRFEYDGILKEQLVMS